VNRRRFLLTSLAGAIAAPVGAEAQQAGMVARIGFLGGGTASGYAAQLEALRGGLRDHGYVEGQSILIEYRWAEGRYERLGELARDLVRLKVDLIVTHGVPGTSAAKQATETIPIVMAIVGDAVAFGLVSNVARPGGNLTGSTFFGPDIIAKRLELFKETLPNASLIAILINPANRAMPAVLKEMSTRARALGVKIRSEEVRKPSEFGQAFVAIAKERADALVIVDDGMLISHASQISDLAQKHRLPAIGFKEYVQAGGLMSYSVDHLRLWRHTAVFVDKILHGASPGDLPIYQATHFELIINLKTAKALGLTIPPAVLARADQVIE
jgi:putative tryptophan/tyrosine transport system substrate-binding protein